MPDHASPTRGLTNAALLLSLLIVASPFVVRWAYRDWNLGMVILASAPVVPLVVFASLTLSQRRRSMPLTSFAVGPLSTAMYIMSIWVAGAWLIGYFFVLLGAIVFPLCMGFLALAWVQPHEDRANLTVVLAIAALPFIVWFAGRADEYTNEALISGGAIALIVVALGLLRRSGTRRPNEATA